MADRLLSVDSDTKLPPTAVLSALADAINADSPVESVAGKTGAVTLSVDDLSDVTVTAPANGQVLRYNGTVWTNQAGGGGGGGAVDSVNGQTGAVVLDAAADSTVVHLAGNETIAGTKTFSAGPAVPTAAPGTSTTQAASTAFVAAGLAGKAATDDLAIINAAVAALDTDKADVDERYWDGDSWTPRPSVPAGVPVKAYSVLDAAATAPPDAVTGDIWFRAAS